MRASPVDLIGGYYKSDSLPWACQDTVNWLPVMAEVEGTRSLKMLETPPGLKPYQQIGTGPIRGMHDCEGLRLIVSGRYLYRISNAGVGVPIGVIPGVGRVSMTHNQFETGYQVLVENGQPGGGYVYSTVDQTFVRITDEGYPGSISSDYLDSYTLGVEPFGRFWFHSDLANSKSYNAIDRAEAESSPDKIVGLKVIGDEVAVFGQRTTDFFYNTGAATGTFQNRRQSLQRGCASRDTIARMDNSLLWLGDDGIVYRLGNGYTAQPVSTRALEQQIAKYNLAQAFAFVWEDRGHKVYYLTFPDGQTFGYDVVTGLWHRRESFGLDRWRLTHVVEWSGRKYGGDFQSGRVFLIDWDYHLEGSESIISERVSPVLSDNQSRLGIPSAELVFDTGQGPGTVAVPFPMQPAAPLLTGDAPDGGAGIQYPGYAYSIQNGTPPYSVVLLAGQLPTTASGTLPLSQSGVIGQAIPSAIGNYPFTLRVTDSVGLWSDLNDSIYISPPWFASFGSTVQRAFPGTTWTGDQAPLPSGAYTFSGNGIVTILQNNGAQYSTDNGATWFSAQMPATTNNQRGVYIMGAHFILSNGGGSGNLNFRSVNGTDYVAMAFPSNLRKVSSLCYINDRLLGLGVASSGGNTITSLDGGVTWPSISQCFPGIQQSVSCAASNGNSVIAFGEDGAASRTVNGISWTSIANPFGSEPVAVCEFLFGLYVAVSVSGKIAYSTSGTDGSWTFSTYDFGALPAAIGSDGFRAILVGAGSRMAVSMNGASWAALPNSIPAGQNISSITPVIGGGS